MRDIIYCHPGVKGGHAHSGKKKMLLSLQNISSILKEGEQLMLLAAKLIMQAVYMDHCSHHCIIVATLQKSTGPSCHTSTKYLPKLSLTATL